MEKTGIIKIVNKVFEETFEIEKEDLSPGKDLFKDLGFDSLDMVDLIVALQKKFKVQIREDERIRGVRTLDELYNFVLTLKEEGIRK